MLFFGNLHTEPAGLLASGDGDFDFGDADKFRYAHRRPRWPRLLEVGRVDRVHSLEQLHVGQIDLDGDDVAKSHTSLLQDQADVVEGLLHFSLESVWDFSGFWVVPSLAGGVERAVGEDARAEGAPRGEFLRLDDLLFSEERQRNEQA